MKILLAVDGSEFSERATKAVAEGTWAPGSAVKIIFVIEPICLPAADGMVIAPQYYTEAENIRREQARRSLDAAASQIRARVAGATLAVETEVMAGSPRRAIVDAAQEWGADLIVVGSHGYGFWSRALLGSVSQAVASHAKCSVLIAR